MYGMMKLPELTLKLGLHTDKGRTLIVGGANQRLQRSSNKSRKGAQTTANEHSVILADLSQSQPSLSSTPPSVSSFEVVHQCHLRCSIVVL